MSEPHAKVYVLITWDRQTDHMGRQILLPLVRTYEDGEEAAEVYGESRNHRDASYLYVTDDSGHMDLILEHERLPHRR